MGAAARAEPMRRRSEALWRRLVLGLFFVSGISGLLYEVAWTRMLHLLFGDTVLAVSTVLASFMAGLALGSFWSGRYVDRRPPSRRCRPSGRPSCSSSTTCRWS